MLRNLSRYFWMMPFTSEEILKAYTAGIKRRRNIMVLTTVSGMIDRDLGIFQVIKKAAKASTTAKKSFQV